jgi:hypothetical protein
MRALLFALLVSLPAFALDPFEIQVYDGTANDAGEAGLELHLNSNQRAHATLEPSYGVTNFWELGAYVQGALLPDGSFAYAGAKLRSKLVTPPDWDEHLRLGINLEVSLLPRSFDASRWGAEIRPIIAWEGERWIFAANPDVSGSLDAAPAFEPGAMAKVKVAGLAIGVEYFGSPSEHRQFLFGAVDVLAWRGIELNLAAGKGLTASSSETVAKAIVGYTFGKH